MVFLADLDSKRAGHPIVQIGVGRNRAVDDPFAEPGAGDDHHLVEVAIGIGLEENPGGLAPNHLLHDDRDLHLVGVDPLEPGVGENRSIRSGGPAALDR